MLGKALMSQPKIAPFEIPLEYIQPDAYQPRKELGIKDEKNSLLRSIKDHGLRSPLALVKCGKDSYRIIDGHRRYTCIKLLGWKTARCEVHPESDEGEIKRIRFNLQNNRRPWKPTERAQEVKQIKKSTNLRTNKQLAEYLHFPEPLLSQSLNLQKRREQHQKLMDEYELSEAYQVEFMQLEPKIRPLKQLSREDIICNLFDRVKYRIIRSAKDFRKLGSVFLRAQANEEELYAFLKNKDMKVDDLTKRTTHSGLVRDIENVMQQITKKLSHGEELTSDVRIVLLQLHKILKKMYEIKRI